MTSLNPLTLLDGLLADYASPKTRRLVHGLVVLLAVIAAIWLAAEGDLKVALASLVAAVYAEANRANTSASPEQVVDYLQDADAEKQPRPGEQWVLDPDQPPVPPTADPIPPVSWGDHLRRTPVEPEDWDSDQANQDRVT